MINMEKEMLISPQEIVKRYNISYQTLNYYTSLGLLEVRKRKGNGRLYKEGEIENKLRRIEELKDQGYPLRLICKMV
jgi:DNA-binding transcriptional MerR regulator